MRNIISQKKRKIIKEESDYQIRLRHANIGIAKIKHKHSNVTNKDIQIQGDWILYKNKRVANYYYDNIDTIVHKFEKVLNKIENISEGFKSDVQLTNRAKIKFPSIEKVTQETDRSYYKFVAYSSKKLTRRIIEILQGEMGYAPAGYGFYGFKESLSDDKFIYKWECSKSS